MIVVTGATGQLGTLVVNALLEQVQPSEIAVAIRNPEKAAAFAARGVALRVADYSKPETLVAALTGANKLLLISSNELGQRAKQHAAVVDAAKEAGVSFIAYTSVLHADTAQLGLAAEHKATENAIRASGIPFAFLRNGWYLENYTEQLRGALARGGLAGSAGSGRISAATRADFAAAAANVLTTTGHDNKVYELAGDASFTMNELAAEVTRQSGKPIGYTNLPFEAYRDILIGAGLPPAMAEVLADADLAIARGELEDTSGALSHLIGRPTTPLATAVKAGIG